MKIYLQETREKFNEYEFKARSTCPETDYNDGGKQERKESVRLMMDQQKRYVSVKPKSSR